MCRQRIKLFAVVCITSLVTFAAASAQMPWPGYQSIMWQDKTARQYEALPSIGVTGARVQADRSGETRTSAREKVSPIIQAELRPYVENIATDFYSAYHRWSPNKLPNAAFLELQRQAAVDPSAKSLFLRRPGLSDPTAMRRIRKRISDIVRIYGPYRPLFFNLGDETGIADLSAAWDFDYSAPSLSKMRLWLKEQYGTLGALNREWSTNFAHWQNVVPPTTTDTMARTDGNYASWSDFKEWMDIAFAKAIKVGSDAVHTGAPWARAAIEGAQMPGWGGYNYIHLAPAVDVMELYDAGQSLEIAQTFNPRLVALTTVNWGRPGARHRAWREFLRGARGMIIWDPNDQFVNADGTLGPDGRAAAPFLDDMRNTTGSLIMASRRVRAPIAVLYSPVSYRLQWLLDHRIMGASWMRLRSEDQNSDNAVRAARRRLLRLLDNHGVVPHFVSEQGIAQGQLEHARHRVLILPQTLALSSKAARVIRNFVRSGGILVSDGDTGLFDAHGRRLARPRLSKLLDGRNPRAIALSRDDGTASNELGRLLETVAIRPEIAIAKDATGHRTPVEHYLYRHRSVLILALLAHPAANEERRSVATRISLRRRSYIYDVRAKRFLGHANELSVDAESTMPTVLAFSANRLSSTACRTILHSKSCPGPAD